MSDFKPPPEFKLRGELWYHPEADLERLAFVDSFTARLDMATAEVARPQKTVDSVHVRRAFDRLVPPTRARKIAAHTFSALFGAALSAIGSIFVALFTIPEGADPEGLYLGLLACIVLGFAFGFASFALALRD